MDIGVGIEPASFGQDRMSSSFCFNSSAISELSSIESNFSRCSGDLSFSRILILTPLKHMDNHEEHEFSVAVSGVKIDLDKSTSGDSFSSNSLRGFLLSLP